MNKSNYTMHVESLKFIQEIDEYLKNHNFITVTLRDNSQVEGEVVKIDHDSAAQLFHDDKGNVWDLPEKMLINLHIRKTPDSKPVIVNFRNIHAWSKMDDYPI